MIIRNLIYILQSENYNWFRFIRFAYSKLSWWNLEKRRKLAWTPKAALLYIITILFSFLAILPFILDFSLTDILLLIPLIFILPFIICLSLLLIKPIDVILKFHKIKKAGEILNNAKITVIGIAGSYGKTSAKEILSKILEEKFKVLKTPENINTDIGIANYIIKNADKFKDYGIFIVEMGAYRIGDIAKICRMVKPEYSILCGINESHLERFGSLGNTVKAKFELPVCTKKTSVLNFADENIKNNYDRYKIREIVKVFGDEAKNITFENGFKGLEFEYEGEKFFTKLLARHNVNLILMCAEVAKRLGMAAGEIKRGAGKINPLPHRLEPIYNKNSDIWIIDDSYNANYLGILSGLGVISRAAGRKIVLTPGLVELGGKSREIHNKIGEAYARTMDLVLLIKNSATPYIIEGMKENNFYEYKVYNSASEAHNDLTNALKSGDTIIFQNDWPDNYL